MPTTKQEAAELRYADADIEQWGECWNVYNPDDVNEAAYRTVYDHITETLASWEESGPEGSPTDIILTELDELEEAVKAIKKAVQA